MWIKSQDGCILINTSNIQVSGPYILAGDSMNLDDLLEVGKYSNKERAREVLRSMEVQLIKGMTYDEIQFNVRTTKNLVFKMPEI